MKINVLVPIVDFKNESVKHPNGEPATFRSVALEILSSADNKQTGTRDNPYELYSLAKKIAEVDMCNLTVKELALLQDKLMSYPGYHTVVVGRMIDIIEGKNKSALAPSAVLRAVPSEESEEPAAEEPAPAKPKKEKAAKSKKKK